MRSLMSRVQSEFPISVSRVAVMSDWSDGQGAAVVTHVVY